MEQNKFEKDIQQKLEGLKIPPSESVWQQVEKRIEKKDERKWKAFIIFFLFLIILTGGYWLLNTEKNSKPHSQKIDNAFKKDITKSIMKNDSSSNQLLVSDINDTSKIAFKNIVKNEKPYKQKSRKTKFLRKGNLKTEIGNELALENKKQPVEEDRNVKKIKNKFSEEKKDSMKHEEGKINLNFIKPKQKTVNQGIINPGKAKKINESDTLEQVVNSQKPVNISRKRKWNFGITISGGTSLIGNGPLGINNSSGNMTTASSGGSIPPFYSPSSIKNSIAVITGFIAETNISEKKKISLGINYKYFSVINRVGNKIDSNQISYYSSASQNAIHNYRNNFNYLELPVSVKFQLGNSKTLPIYWQAGITISHLISSNALQYKSNSGLYYHDNSLFKKIQLGFSTGFSAVLFSKEKYPVTIGPYFYYSTSKIANEGLYNKKHFSFIGISSEILLKKK